MLVKILFYSSLLTYGQQLEVQYIEETVVACIAQCCVVVKPESTNVSSIVEKVEHSLQAKGCVIDSDSQVEKKFEKY